MNTVYSRRVVLLIAAALAVWTAWRSPAVGAQQTQKITINYATRTG